MIKMLMHLEAYGPRLEYVWHGPPPDKSPTLVFLHEGLGSVSTWRDFPARLAAATGRAALVVSRAGYGRSPRKPGPWPVEFMHEEATALAVDADSILVGHSDGASIALLYA